MCKTDREFFLIDYNQAATAGQGRVYIVDESGRVPNRVARHDAQCFPKLLDRQWTKGCHQ